MIKQRTYDEIRQSIRNNIHDLNTGVDTKAGTFVSDVFVCPSADQLASFYTDMKIMELNQCVTTASGYDLDRLGMNYFTYREGAEKAIGTVRFYIERTNKLNLDINTLPRTIYIPTGTIVATESSSSSSEAQFVTTSSAYISNTDIFSLPTDTATGYKYVECDIEAREKGEKGNVSAGAIDTVVSQIEGVSYCMNTLSTVGGRDAESDMSFKTRIMLAVLGASICTKKGYLKFVIQQEFVQDAMVIGAGDILMFRDGGYINDAKEYIYGRGGMVDIWLRGKNNHELTQRINITSAYIRNGCQDILLETQPVLKIVSVSSALTGEVYKNADNYDIEYSITVRGVTKRYFKDILWDFSITQSFEDLEYYPMNLTDTTEIEILRKRLNQDLQNIAESMSNMSYSINWATVTYDTMSSFEVVKYNKNIYKIICLDARLNGRTFVKKNNKIYLRIYEEPDYALSQLSYSQEDKNKSQTNMDIGGSIISKDSLHWLNKSILNEGDVLNITYEFNKMISDIQTAMDAKRILTADILVRQAKEVKIQVAMTVYVDETISTITVRNTIATKFSTYINYMLAMGAKLEKSLLVSMARDTYGVTRVDLTTVSLIIKEGSVQDDIIQLEPNEYFILDSADINAIAEITLIA